MLKAKASDEEKMELLERANQTLVARLETKLDTAVGKELEMKLTRLERGPPKEATGVWLLVRCIAAWYRMGLGRGPSSRPCAEPRARWLGAGRPSGLSPCLPDDPPHPAPRRRSN